MPSTTKGPASAIKDAERILKTGDPVKYLLDTFSSMHKGDSDTAMVLLVSIATQSTLNSDGIHPALSGESGKGKSHVCKTILHLVPEDYWLNSSLSGKAPFYYDMNPGLIVFSDDSTISEELESAIKRATSDFQEETTHLTVNTNRKGILLTIPPRISWWLANVDTDMSAQAINRQFGVTIDETEEMDKEVKDFQLEKAETGEIKFPITDEVLICREMMRIVKDVSLIVKIPFSKNIVWKGYGNRRNLPIFLDIIRAFAVLRFKQRIECGENAIEATMEDYDDAKKLYSNRAETQTTKLNDLELKLIHILASSGGMDTTQLQTAMETYQVKIHNLIHGRGGSGGLLAKVPELQCEKAAVRVETSDGFTKTVQKNIYTVHNFDLFGSYGEIVGIETNGVMHSAEINKQVRDMMREFEGATRYYNTSRGFEMIRTKLEDKAINIDVIESAIENYKKEAKL